MTTRELTKLVFGRDEVVDMSARRGMVIVPVAPEDRDALEQQYAEDFARSKAMHSVRAASIRP